MTIKQLTPQECVEYADKKAREVPEPLRLQVYWGTLLALILTGAEAPR